MMVNSCAAYHCQNRSKKGGEISFHKFPLKNTDLCRKWVTATKRDGFVPSDGSYICGEHFTKDDYLFSNSNKLKDGAIPSVFSFPSHYAEQHNIPGTVLSLMDEHDFFHDNYLDMWLYR